MAYCTFKQGSDVPDVDATSLHKLSQSDLQEEDRDSSDEDDQHVGDQEDACRRTETFKFTLCKACVVSKLCISGRLFIFK